MENVKRNLEEAHTVFAHLDGLAVIAVNTLISATPTHVHSEAIAQAFPEAFIVPAVRDSKENTALKVGLCIAATQNYRAKLSLPIFELCCCEVFSEQALILLCNLFDQEKSSVLLLCLNSVSSCSIEYDCV